ncbi:MAG: efflux RND transporter permease subunit [Candidatus Latescibacteria bacterium]|nr:efflux RND transporter permease subunit [Candidatus Latescibacterota bacterium]
MKKIIQFSVEYPITILMLVLAVILLGTISFQRLGMDLFPDLNNPRIFVELKAGERPPEEIEKQFVKNIEAQAIRQKNAIQVSSVSRVGSAQITVEYAWETNMDEAYLDLQKTLTDFQQNSDIDELTLSQHDPNASPVILLGLSHSQITDMDELRKIAESYIQNELIRLEGIADVRLMGQEEKEVVIETNNYLLEAHNITPSTIASRINEFNRNVTGGSLSEMGTRYIIRGVSEFKSVDDIANVIVTYGEPAAGTETTQSATETTDRVPVFLKDVASIHLRNKEPDNIVHLNGERCMALAIYKETHYNTVKAVGDFMNTLETIRKALPGYNLTVIQNKGEFIASAIDEVKTTAMIGIFLAIVVLYVFLRRLGITAIISVAIPFSIIATFNLMYFNGLTLNIMTLGGLALGAGMLVDNAIVVMENVIRNLESGLSLREAAIEGTSQVSGAITASTVTTIMVFLPIVYLHGSAGELFKDQAWTVAFSLFSSLVVAILVIPMLSSRFLRKMKQQKQRSVKFFWYSKFLGRLLKLRWLVILMAIGLIVISIRLIPVVGSEFMPKSDQNEFTVEIKLPEGTELYRTANTVTGIEKSIAEVLGDDIETLYSIVGPSQEITEQSGSVFEDENTAMIKIVLKKEHVMPSDAVSVHIGNILSTIPDLEAHVFQEQTVMELTLGSEISPVVIEVQGEDLDQIQDLTEQAKQCALTLNELYNVETTFDEGRPEIDVVLDRTRAGIYNIGIDTVNSQLTGILTGTEGGQWDYEGELKDITIELPRISVSQIDDITINSSNQNVRLYEIADIQVSQAPKEIYRRNQVRVGKVMAHITGGVPLDHVVQRLENVMKGISFPPDYRYTITGEEQKRKEAFQNLKFALILSLILVYMVLAAQFESLIHPFTIILSVPLAGVGVVALFLILGRTFNIMAYIGIIMLVGIAVNDSIILVDAINQLKREGYKRFDAIIEAGQRRIRPIIMTSLTTILALLPLTFGFGEGASLRSPMAFAVIGGLITSTLLTLLVIPCLYAVMDNLTAKE